MESVNNVINLIKPNVYMVSIDLKDAFFSVPIYKNHQRHLKFIFENLFQFISMPSGYGPPMINLTETSKVPFGHLRNQGHNSAVYVYDSYLQKDFGLLRELGFVIHPDKSVLTPSQTVVFSGFVISSKHMTLSLTDGKKNKIKTLLINCLHSLQVSIREPGRILWNIVASFSAVNFGPLNYRHLERYKIRGLKYHKGNFEGKISLSSKTVSEIHWWINNIDNSCDHINNIPSPCITIHADASVTDWRITNGISRLEVSDIKQN